jgi:serine/threonine-protein kinase
LSGSDWVDQGLLATGAMAEVRRVVRGGRDAVLKRIRADQAANRVFQALLETETAALQRLIEVPEVVRLLDAGPGWLVLERADPLGPVAGWDQARPVLDAVGRALTAAHAAGIVHRDVKRANVLRTARGPVLADFGAARIEGRPDPAPALGSPEAFAPERLRGEPATAASDRFAYGVLAWELVTGAPPWVGTRWADHLARAEPVAPDVVPERVVRWLRALLAPEPTARPEPQPPT